MENRTARLKRIRILAVALVLLSLLILLVSAYIRLSGAGLGCSPFPQHWRVRAKLWILRGGRVGNDNR